MKQISKFLLLSVCLAQSPQVFAEIFSNQFLSLDVPQGFEGPTTASPGPGAKMEGFVKAYAGDRGGTLLQITTYDFGSSLDGMPEEERGNASEYYLGQFLGGIERKRTSFSASKPERIVLGGLPASRVKWTGNVNGVGASGVMYCLVIRTTVVSFHTQDIDGAPEENRALAIAAFEGMRVRGGR